MNTAGTCLTQVAQYDSTEVAGQGLAKKRRGLFEATRQCFREQVAEIPIADKVPGLPRCRHSAQGRSDE